jgi:hypothetical protein
MVMHAIVRAQQAQLAQAQVQQLHALNTQLYQQMAEQQRQAMLQQLLFDTEQMARRVWATGKSDPFAAAVHAESWRAGVGSVGPEMFSDVNAKRAWSAAVGHMQAASTRARQDPAIAPALQAYNQASRDRQVWLTTFNGDPDEALRRLSSEIGAEESRLPGARNQTLLLGGFAIACFLFAVLMFVLASVTDADVAGLGILSLFGTCLPAVLAVFSGLRCREISAKTAKLRSKNVAMQREAAAFRAFEAAPIGGQLLARMASEHPLLFEQPPASAFDEAPPSQLIERQVVVTRCQYCGELTPVDLAGCKNCGARLK